MYGLIHKLKKKVKLKNNIHNHKNKRLAYSIWFCPVLLFEKCACCNPSESTAQFWCLVLAVPLFRYKQ